MDAAQAVSGLSAVTDPDGFSEWTEGDPCLGDTAAARRHRLSCAQGSVQGYIATASERSFSSEVKPYRAQPLRSH